MSAGWTASPRILLTGGSGFVGRWLAQALRRDLPGEGRLICVDRATPVEPGLEFLQLDITQAEATDAVLQETRPTCVIHLAAMAAVGECRREPHRAWSVNVHGTMNLAQAVLRHVPDASFLYVSTSEVYGGSFRTCGGRLDEGALLDPANSYAASKAAADILLGQMARDGLNVVRFRPFNHTGPGQTEEYVIPAFAAQIARIERSEQQSVIRVGNLESQRDFLDVRDVVRAYAIAALLPADAQLPPGTILNLASGVPRRVGDVLDALLRRSRMQIEVEPDPARVRPSDTPFALGDASRAERLLGWKPTVSWDRTLDDVLAYWRGSGSRAGRVV